MSIIECTYQHIKKIGPKREALIWQAGSKYWAETLRDIEKLELPKVLKEALAKELPHSIRNFQSGNIDYFIRKLPDNQLFRIYPYIKNKIVYLDIETTGMKPDSSHITVIGCYDGKETRVFVHGRNEKEFLEYIKKYEIVVTFNGSCFDIPFIEKYFDTKLSLRQIDLRFVLKDLGIAGGLKKIESLVGLDRGGNMEGVNGFTAVLLWQYYVVRRDMRALNTLIHYNVLDTINLEYLVIYAYNSLAKSLGEESSIIDVSMYNTPKVSSKYEVDKELIDYLHKNSYKYIPKQ